MRLVRRLAVSLIVLLAVLSTCAASEIRTPSADRLPSGYWVYDAMESLAADGLVTNRSARVFHGDRLFTRLEMARELEATLNSIELNALNPSQSTLIDSLIKEFQPELTADNFDVAAKWHDVDLVSRPLQYTGYVGNAASSDVPGEDTDNNVGYRLATRYNLNDHTFVGATVTNDRTDPMHFFKDTDELDSAYIRTSDKNGTWSLGREYMQWGPAYSGSLILSDNGPSLFRLYNSTGVRLGKRLGDFKLTQYVSSFKEDGETIYLMGRRVEKALAGNHLFLGISEAAKTNVTPGPDVLVLPLYLYQHLHQNSDGSNINNLLAVDLLYESKSRNQIYCQALGDEMTSPFFWPGDHTKTKQKAGYIIGFYTPKLTGGSKPTDLRAEYLHLDGGTYSTNASRDASLAYDHDGYILGHPFAPNAKGIYLRSERDISSKAGLIMEYYNLNRSVENMAGKGNISMLSMQLSYDITPAISARLRVAPYKQSPYGEAETKDTAFWFQTMCSF